MESIKLLNLIFLGYYCFTVCAGLQCYECISVTISSSSSSYEETLENLLDYDEDCVDGNKGVDKEFCSFPHNDACLHNKYSVSALINGETIAFRVVERSCAQATHTDTCNWDATDLITENEYENFLESELGGSASVTIHSDDTCTCNTNLCNGAPDRRPGLIAPLLLLLIAIQRFVTY